MGEWMGVGKQSISFQSPSTWFRRNTDQAGQYRRSALYGGFHQLTDQEPVCRNDDLSEYGHTQAFFAFTENVRT